MKMEKMLLSALAIAVFIHGQPSAQEFIEGEILLCLRAERPEPVRKLSSGRIVSGISGLDEIMLRHSAVTLERFSGYTALTKKLYRLKVPRTTDIDRLLQELANDPSVQFAERVDIPTRHLLLHLLRLNRIRLPGGRSATSA